MAEQEGLELKIKSSLDQTTSILEKVKSTLKDTNVQIQSVTHTIDDQSKYLVKAKGEWTNYILEVNKAGNVKLKSISQDYAGKLRDEQKAIRQQTLDINDQTRTINQAIGIITARAYLAVRMMKQIAGGLKTCITQAVDFNETVNKFNVAMGGSVDRATEFQDKLSEAFGTSKKEMMDYQATFKNIMSTTAGLSEDTAEKISETLVKMGLDYSSLYNVDQKSAMEKYQGALTGSIRPIRNGSGYDVSKNAIMETAKGLGVDKTYNDLNEMERRLLRIITLMDQMKNTGAMQDLARTIEQPANQLKVLQNQLQEVQVWLGNVFMGTLGSILPYINGFVMAIKELIKTFAIFVGYRDNSSKLPDVFEQTRTATGGISKNLGSAAKSTKNAANAAKEFRKQLMGFDVLNVINKPTPSTNTGGGSTGGGGGSVGGIDPKILNALKDYDNMMDQITMKATKIRDKILDWLGATDGSYKNLKRIVIIAGTILGILKLIKTIGAIANFITMLKGGVPVASNFAAGLKTIAGGANGIKTAIANAGGGFTGFLSVLKATIPTVLKFVSVIGGIVLSVKGVVDVIKLYSNMMETGEKDTKAMTLAGVELAAGGALIGAAFGPVGAAVGAFAGALVFLIANIIGANKAMQDTIDKDLFGSITISTKEWKKSLEELDPEMKDFDSKLDDYTSSMQSYYDSFSQAEDTIDRYATKFSLASYKISDEDIKNMGKAIEEFSTNATGTVETTTNRMIDLWSQTYKSNDGTIDEGERSMLSKIQSYGDDQKATIKSAQDLITQTYQKGIGERGYLTEEERKTIENALSQIQDLVKNNMSTSETNMQYYVDNTKKKTSQAGADVLNITKDSYENFKKAQDEYLEEQEKNRTEKYNEQLNNLNAMHNAGKISTQEYNDALAKINEERAKGENETNQKVTEYRDQLFSGLYRKYIELEGKTDKTSKKERKELEDMFKDANIDTSYVESQAWNKGENIGNTFHNQVQTYGQVDLDNSLTYNANDIYRKGQNVGTILKNGVETKMHFGINIDDSGKWHWSWKNYATGGLPETGQMFVAREAGPELVGRIGSQTGVINNQQIIQGVAQGVASAVASVMRGYNNGGGSFNIYLDGDQLSATVQRRNEIYDNMTGR